MKLKEEEIVLFARDEEFKKGDTFTYIGLQWEVENVEMVTPSYWNIIAVPFKEEGTSRPTFGVITGEGNLPNKIFLTCRFGVKNGI